MPLASLYPTIDDRTVDQIKAEAKSRIPRYTPEWTDHNESDPGIVLLELFSWMSEQLIYRLNKVPQLNYLKFLELIGIELQAARPAMAEVTFPVRDGYSLPTVSISAGTRVAAESADEGGTIVFETERALTSLTAPLRAVQSYDGYAYADVTELNDDAIDGFKPFGDKAVDGSALLLGFASTSAFPAMELTLAFWMHQDQVGPAHLSCAASAGRLQSSPQLAWETWTGSAWKTLTVLEDETANLTRSGFTRLRTPGSGMARAALGGVADAHYWIRARVARAGYERAPALLAVRTNTAPVVQAQTVEYEILGGSDGMSGQEFSLSSVPVLRGSLELEVDEGASDGFEVWTEVEDFFASGSRDRHFVLNPASGVVRFGDGERGQIPVANPNRPGSNIRARRYRFGGGQKGNVKAGEIKTLQTSITGIDSSKVKNLGPAHDGADEESLEDAQDRARIVLQRGLRAVTAADFEQFAREAANVARAKAVPLLHPAYPGIETPGVVTVILVPESEDPAPLPSEATMRTVCAYLNERRLLTTEVYVARPTYRLVRVVVDLIASDNGDSAAVRQAVEDALKAYLHPLTGGDDGTGWPFGGTVFFSSLYRLLLGVEGVQRIDRLVIQLDGREQPECRDVSIGAGELVYSTEHEIVVAYEESE